MSIWIIVEASEGRSPAVSYELVAPATQLSQSLGQPVTAVVLAGSGDDTSGIETSFGALGVPNVLVVKHEQLATYQPGAYTKAISDLIQARNPTVVLFADNSTARDYAPRVAIRCNASLLGNVSDLKLEGGVLSGTKACFAEALISTVSGKAGQVQMATIKAKTYEKPAESGGSASVEAVTPELSGEAGVKLVNVSASDTAGKPKLEEAEIIVSGGRGLKEASNFSLVEDLAASLGAAVGASRAVVDAGWRPHSEQVGQTGKTVSPKVYVAVAISGAIQHLVGMRTSNNIIAINNNAEAPIFETADLGVVGDAFEIVPLLTQTLKEQTLPKYDIDRKIMNFVERMIDMTTATSEPLAVGTKAPDFDLPATGDQQIKLSDYAGKNLIIVFYPKDQTPGCTRQLCALRDDLSMFEGLNTAILGSNPGSLKSHENFVEKQNYPFPILVDADRTMAKDYNALKENGTSIQRTVYIIDGNGNIVFSEQGMPSDEQLADVIRNLG